MLEKGSLVKNRVCPMNKTKSECNYFNICHFNNVFKVFEWFLLQKYNKFVYTQTFIRFFSFH